MEFAQKDWVPPTLLSNVDTSCPVVSHPVTSLTSSAFSRVYITYTSVSCDLTQFELCMSCTRKVLFLGVSDVKHTIWLQGYPRNSGTSVGHLAHHVCTLSSSSSYQFADVFPYFMVLVDWWHISIWFLHSHLLPSDRIIQCRSLIPAMFSLACLSVLIHLPQTLLSS